MTNVEIVRAGADVKDIQVLRGPPIEVAQGERRTAHEPDAGRLTRITKLGDEITEADDDRVAVQRGAGHQTLAKVSADARTPRSANSFGTSSRSGAGSARSTRNTTGSVSARSGLLTHPGSGMFS